jgi:TrfA protein
MAGKDITRGSPRKLDELLAGVRARSNGSTGQPAQPEPQPRKLGLQLPIWAEPVRGVPNGVLRSALFGAVKSARGKDRRQLDGEQMAAVDGVQIICTGQRLDQDDLDVWETLVHAARMQNLGTAVCANSYALLKLMGLTDTGKNRKLLHERIVRIRSHTIELRQGTRCYIGGLVQRAAKDMETHEWIIELDERLLALYGDDQFTQFDWDTRRSLNGQPLAQWLHGFYATHADPFPIKVATLRRLCGSETARLDNYRKNLRTALQSVHEAHAARGEPWGWCIDANDCVVVTKKGTISQQRHVAKKKAKA